MSYHILAIMQNQHVYDNLRKKIDWNSGEFKLVSVEFHASLGLQRFISSKPDIVLVDPKAVVMDIDKYIDMMENYSGHFAIILCSSQHQVDYDIFSNRVSDTVEISKISDVEFQEVLRRAIQKLHKAEVSTAPKTKISFFTTPHSKEEIFVFFKSQIEMKQWDSFWFLHCKIKKTLDHFEDIAISLEALYKRDTLLYFPISSSSFLIILNGKSFTSIQLIEKKIVGMIQYQIGSTNTVYYTGIYSQNFSSLYDTFTLSNLLLEYAYFLPGEPHLTLEKIEYASSPVELSQVDIIVDDICMSVIKKKLESAYEYIDMLYFCFLKNSMNFHLLKHVRERLQTTRDFICYLLDSEYKHSPQMVFSDIYKEAEFLKQSTSVLSEKITDRIRCLNPALLKMLYYTYINYAQRDLSLSMIAEHVNRTPSYLSSLFSSSMGMRFTDYISDIRIRQAKKMLLQTKQKIQDIAYAVGISDQRYFSSIFRKRTGMTPSEYRRIYKN